MSKEVKEIYHVSEIEKGYYICWSVCTQCWNACKVELKDETGKTYFSYSKKYERDGNLKFLGEGHGECTGSKLQLEVTCDTDTGEIKQTINSYRISVKERKIGHGYNLCFEDSSDDDFNDVYVNLVGWKNKG